MLRSPVERHSGGKAPSLVRYMQACNHAAASADPGWVGNIPGGTLALFGVSLCVRVAEEMGSLQAVKTEGSAGTPSYLCTTERKLLGISSLLDASAIWGRCVSTQPLPASILSGAAQPGPPQ